MLTQGNDFISFQFEKSTLNIVVHSKQPTDEEWEETKSILLSYYKAHLKEHTRFAIVCNLQNMSLLSVERTTDWANFFMENTENTKKCIQYTIFITDSSIIRMSMNVFFSLYTPVRPLAFLNSYDDIQEWVAQNKDNCED